jgi:hypothetical protein
MLQPQKTGHSPWGDDKLKPGVLIQALTLGADLDGIPDVLYGMQHVQSLLPERQEYGYVSNHGHI